MRYADDMMIFCKSRKSAERTLANIKPFIEKKLFLKLNEDKTKIRYIGSTDVKFLGFGFYPDKEGKIKDRPHQKSKDRCVKRLREITTRSRGQSLEAFRKQLSEFVRGWVNYFLKSDMIGFVQETDQWLRRRIRQIYWKQWKKVGTKYSALKKLVVSPSTAWQHANTRKSYWHIANSWILATTLTNRLLRELGWVCLGDVYKKRNQGCY